MFSIFKNHGILGINARNLLYLRPYNPKKAIQLADDKIKTKHFLEARGIPVPKLIARIQSEEDLERFDWTSLPDEFVLKPNSGYGGEGIVVIVGRKRSGFLKINGDVMSLEDMASHIESILSGRFSLDHTFDTAFFEQRLVPHDVFKHFTNTGLPDVRVVVHNLIPAMAMLRIPTRQSEGKANVHLGGVGIGIDIAKGITTHAVQHNEIIQKIPRFGDPSGVKIPYWDEILMIASNIQKISNLGYLACDIVIDKNRGPVLLEINARAGLMVQIANLAPLRRRLERIEGIKVTTPEKGVRIGQDLFGEKVIREDSDMIGKMVVGHKEIIEILMTQGTKKVVARIRPDLEKTTFTPELLEELQKAGGVEKTKKQGYKVKFNLADKKIQTLVTADKMEGKDYEVVIGRRDLTDVLIDPLKPSPLEPAREDKKIKSKKKSAIDYASVDKRLCDMDRKTKLLVHLQPVNLVEEREKFFDSNCKYNPQFTYPEIEFDVEDLKDRLQYVHADDSPLGKILENKKQEIINKIDLLTARGKPELFTEKSIALYGKPSATFFKRAQEDLKQVTFNKYVDSDFDAMEVKERFNGVFEEYHLDHAKVILKDTMVSDCSAGKKGAVFLKTSAMFSQKRIEMLILHEIETHLLTAENGTHQPYEVFHQGTANYLTTQEGLAVYNQETFNTHGLIGDKGAYSFCAVFWALNYSFVEVYERLRQLGLSEKRAFQVTLKVKRGLTDTSQAGAFTKNAIYYIGFQHIQRFVEEGGDLKDLYIGKISLEEIDLYQKIKELKRPKYIPGFLH